MAGQQPEDDERRLWRSALPPGSGAELVATKHAGLARITPLTPAAAAWLEEYAETDASWDHDALIVELSYFPILAEAAIAGGLAFERDPLLD